MLKAQDAAQKSFTGFRISIKAYFDGFFALTLFFTGEYP
jgi:hypothetical protein